MKSTKEMKQAIKAYVSSLPDREWNRNIITKIGSKFVTMISLYEGSKVTRYTISEFYNDYMPENYK